MEIKIVVDKKGHVIRKLVSEKKSINRQVSEIIGKSQVLKQAKQQTQELKDLSEKAVYHE